MSAQAQGYPTRPVRLILGYPAGGSTDLVARIMGAWLAERLGQSFVIENKPGAGTNLAAQAVVASPPDGYTLLFVATTYAINATFHKTLPYDFLRDIAPVAALVDLPFVVEVGPSVPARTVAEFIAHAKANPGKVNMASFGTGTISHLAWELFKNMTGIEMVHVPYPGGAPMVTDLIAEKRVAVREKRARALFVAIEKAWEEQYAERSVAMAVHHLLRPARLRLLRRERERTSMRWPSGNARVARLICVTP